MCRRLTSACALLALTTCATFCAPAPPAAPTVEDEVLANIRDQAVGDHTLADFDLPESFLRRIADRIVRSSYLERYRSVVGPLNDPAMTGQPPTTASAEASPPGSLIPAPARSDVTSAYRRQMQPGRPELRGYRVPLFDDDPWPYLGPGPGQPAELRRAADIVGRRLARDGLLQTVAQVIQAVGGERWLSAGEAELGLLRSSGLPVDWLVHFHAGDDRPAVASGSDEATAGAVDPLPERAMFGVIRAIATAVLGEAPDSPDAIARRFRFEFLQSRDGYRVATESGEDELALVRLQLTRGDYWAGEGDGGSVDIARQMMTRLPETHFAISIERRFASTLQALASDWSLPDGASRRLLEAPGPISQWAQDNGKAGLLREQELPPVPATLTPRYASRREDGSELMPNESFLLETLPETGHVVIQSPLLFQGGDLLAVRDPTDGSRILFIGEAEIHRNTALGLGREQVLEAFRAELGVDRCEVLPSISFHVDFDVTFRAHDGRLVAFVNDREAGARMLIEQGLGPLARQGTLEGAATTRAKELLRDGKDEELVELITTAIQPHARSPGSYASTLARGFEDGSPQGSVANLQRFLLALDMLASTAMTERDLRGEGHERAYFRALKRQRAQREELVRQLRKLGHRVIPVPGFSEGRYSVSYLNGIHARGLYLMPAFGGHLAAIDTAATQVFQTTLGDDVEIVPIYCPESQRRLGGLHCSAAAYPRTGTFP